MKTWIEMCVFLSLLQANHKQYFTPISQCKFTIKKKKMNNFFWLQLSPPSETCFTSTYAYNNSKLFSLMFALEGHRRWNAKDNVRFIAVHPGNMIRWRFKYSIVHSWVFFHERLINLYFVCYQLNLILFYFEGNWKTLFQHSVSVFGPCFYNKIKVNRGIVFSSNKSYFILFIFQLVVKPKLVALPVNVLRRPAVFQVFAASS